MSVMERPHFCRTPPDALCLAPECDCWVEEQRRQGDLSRRTLSQRIRCWVFARIYPRGARG